MPPNRNRHEAVIEVHDEAPFAMSEPGEQRLDHRPSRGRLRPGRPGLPRTSSPSTATAAGARTRPPRSTTASATSKRFDAGGPFDPESNYLFGEGGAGTFSDGKLTCRGAGPDVRRVLELFAECKGKPVRILYDHRPHLGSNRLPAVVKAMRRQDRGHWAARCASSRASRISTSPTARLRGVATSSGYIAATVVVLAIGHSARDTFAMLLVAACR